MALSFVLVLMGGLALALKKLGLTSAQNIKQGEKRRLKIIESLPLDARRRAVILRCDDAEHLLILNANGETLVAKDIPAVDSLNDSSKAS
ncbi:MAG: flagellar biosynthetic protein FliO [Alphaproteobacteria bacterium]|nr:flagellar biosynthetic protein FliO [Alphaproteobacteria bacterium]